MSPSDSHSTFPNTSARAAFFLAGALLIAATPLKADLINWTGGGAGLTWTEDGFINWGGFDPAGQDLVFGPAGAGSSPDTITSVIDNSITARSLSFRYESASLVQVLEIKDGATLTLQGSGTPFLLGGYVGTATTPATHAVITGGGALSVLSDGGSFSVRNNRTGTAATPLRATLDMRGLARFDVSLGATGTFNVGTPAPGEASVAQGSVSTVYLAKESNLSGGFLRLGSNDRDTQISLGTEASTLYLREQTSLNFDKIHIGYGYASSGTGALRFDLSNQSGGQVVIRNEGGVDAVGEMVLGYNSNNPTGTFQTGTADFSGGEVDAKVTLLVLGAGNSSSATGAATGSLTMDRGSFEVETVLAGVVGGSGTGTATHVGSINVGGGTFTAESITLGQRNSGGTNNSRGEVNVYGNGRVVAEGGITAGAVNDTTSSTHTGSISISGGTLVSRGDITFVGSAASAIANVSVDGGTLDMQGNAMNVSTFNARSGVVRNISSLQVGGNASGLNKTGDGVLRIAGVHAFAGGISANGGTLLVDDDALPDTGEISIGANGAVAFRTSGSVQDAIAAGRIASGSTGAIALSSAQGGETVNLGSVGTGLSLGALGDVKYTGALTPAGGVYRLGGGSGTLYYASDITDESSVQIGVGTGIVELTGNNSYRGGTSVTSGTLRVNQVSELGATDSALLLNGGTLQWAAGSTADVTAGRTVTLGANGARLDVGQGNDVTLTGSIGGNSDLVKTGAGTLATTGLNHYTGATRIAQGRLVADLSENNTGVIQATSALVLGGGTFEVKGKSGSASSQTLASLKLEQGTGSRIVLTPNGGSSTTLNLGNTWTREAGSTLLVDLSAGGVLASAPVASVATQIATNTVLQHTVVKDAGGYGFGVVQNNNVVRFTAMNPLPINSAAFGSTQNYVVGAGNTVRTAQGAAFKTLTINTATGSGSLDLGNAAWRLSLGAILMQGGDDYAINNGIVGANNAELIIHQYSTGNLTLSGAVSGGTGSLTKAGTGALVLTGASGYTGATSVTDGTLRIATGGSLGSTAISVNHATLAVDGTAGGSVSLRNASSLIGVGSIGGSVDLSGGTVVQSAGRLYVAGDLSVSGTGNALSSGEFLVNGRSTIQRGATWTNNGTLGGGKVLTVYGHLDGAGTINKDTYIGLEGTISGGLTVNGTVSGAGSVNPGNSPGMLTFGQIDGGSGLSFNFEFNEKNGFDWGNLSNDVVRLTGSDAFDEALSGENQISIYLGASLAADLNEGDLLLGGFYSDHGSFDADVQNANFRFFYEDAAGTVLYNGVTYSSYSLGMFEISSIADTRFGVDGHIMQLAVIPEPGTVMLLSIAFGGLIAGAARRSRRAI